MAAAAPWITDVLVVGSLLMATLAVWGIVRFDDVYLRLHAASKLLFIGLLPLLATTATTGDPAMLGRAVLIAAFFFLTAPVSAHAIARAAYLASQPSEARRRRPDRRDASPP
jgi:multicomponent Na+:H+ antiporter subunit G